MLYTFCHANNVLILLCICIWFGILHESKCEPIQQSFPLKYSKEGLLIEHSTVHASYSHAIPEPAFSLSELPANFDWSNVNGTNFLTPSWNQHQPIHYCGSCYIHGTLSGVNDRIKIKKYRQNTDSYYNSPDIMVSRQALLNCIGDLIGPRSKYHGGSDGCYGGTTQEVFKFMKLFGLPDETCFHYVAESGIEKSKKEGTCNPMGMCMNCMAYDTPVMEHYKCWPVLKYVKYKVTEYGKLPSKDTTMMMSEIMRNGPIVCSLATDDGFDYGYSGGVWRVENKEKSSNHVVEITGWGETSSGVKFWQVRNSWGNYFGDEGFFKIERGKNLMLIEDDCWFMDVDWSEEKQLLEGDMVGSMYGLQNKSKHERMIDDEFRRNLVMNNRMRKNENVVPVVENEDTKKNHGENLKWILSAFLIGLCGFLIGCSLTAIVISLWLKYIRRRTDYSPID